MSKFKYYIPSIDIKKGKDDNGEDVYTFEGKAGGMERDYDGEIVVPEGADLTDFKTVNWQHSKNPEDIIGEITEYSVDADTKDLMIKGKFYPSSKKAQSVVGLMQVLENDATNLKLGLSVEGRAIERNSDDETIVTKSKLTGVAVCTVPKNPSTWAKLLKKGFTSEGDEEEFDMVGENYLDFTDSEGNRYVINKSFDINIEKAKNKHEFSQEEREALAKEGKALPDGSFPIRNLQDLKDAIKSIGRAKNQGKVKRWIKKRAKDLKAEDELPEEWNKAEVQDEDSENNEEKAVMAGSATGAQLYNTETSGASLKTESLDDDVKVQVAKGIVDLVKRLSDKKEELEKCQKEHDLLQECYSNILLKLKS